MNKLSAIDVWNLEEDIGLIRLVFETNLGLVQNEQLRSVLLNVERVVLEYEEIIQKLLIEEYNE